MGLLAYDKGNPKIPRHFKPSSTDDEFETPPELFKSLCQKYDIHPRIDVAATPQNSKCVVFFTKEKNGLEQDWIVRHDMNIRRYDIWMNHPHTLHAEFAEKAFNEWKKWNINIMAIFPANCGRTEYWAKFVEGHAEYHFIRGSITFLKDGKPSEFSSRNAYLVVIWRKVE